MQTQLHPYKSTHTYAHRIQYPMSIYMRMDLGVDHHRYLAINKLVTYQATTRISVYYYKIDFGDDIVLRMRWWQILRMN